MKKLLIIILSVIFIFVLSGCDISKSNKKENTESYIESSDHFINSTVESDSELTEEKDNNIKDTTTQYNSITENGTSSNSETKVESNTEISIVSGDSTSFDEGKDSNIGEWDEN